MRRCVRPIDVSAPADLFPRAAVRLRLRDCRSERPAAAFLASLVDEFLVADAVRLVGVVAEPALPVGVVVGVVALEPNDSAFALEGQNVRRDAIEKPAIV